MKAFSIPPKFVAALWLFFLIGCLIIFFSNPSFFEPKFIAEFIGNFNGPILIIYLIISLLRGFTLIPSTPFVLAGTILFPQNPWTVLIISLAGIIFSSTIIYFFSDYLGFGNYFKDKCPAKISKIENYLQKPTGFFFVLLWSFFPAVPTDLVCYVAGTLRMNFWKYITALGLGEFILCSIYIFCYGFLHNFFLQYL